MDPQRRAMERVRGGADVLFSFFPQNVTPPPQCPAGSPLLVQTAAARAAHFSFFYKLSDFKKLMVLSGIWGGDEFYARIPFYKRDPAEEVYTQGHMGNDDGMGTDH